MNDKEEVLKVRAATGETGKLQLLKNYVCEAASLEEFLSRLEMVRADELEKQAEAAEDE